MGCGASTNSNPNISNGNIESNGGVPNNFQGPNTTGVSRKITSVKPYRHGSPITQADLETRRNVFWGTQVQGNADMWNALRTASNALLNQDYNLANAILEASNISTPNASLEICYDERGFEYKVPIFCYSKPIELSNANTLPEANLVSTNPKPNTIITAAPLHLRVRVNPGDYNLQVDASTADSILALKRTILEQSQEKQVILLLSGRDFIICCLFLYCITILYLAHFASCRRLLVFQFVRRTDNESCFLGKSYRMPSCLVRLDWTTQKLSKFF